MSKVLEFSHLEQRVLLWILEVWI